ncbi:MAG: 30S ribosomal protein S3 [Elusimicrobiota bacterium]|nr:30S ribosomal protein S3 [Elusimicrobiota bacterium]
MGQKVPPIANRLGYIETWTSKWFARKNQPELIEEDFKIRQHIKQKLKYAAVSKTIIERAGKYLRISIYTARPGIVIGRHGQEIENLRQDIELLTGKKTVINVMEIREPTLDAQLVAEAIALQLERNMPYRRVINAAIARTMSNGALGIKVMVSGRLDGAEIARSEWLKEGRIPLHTYRANIDYGFAEAIIKKGKIGVKVWIFKQELFRKTDKDLLKEAELVEKEKVEELPLENPFEEEIIPEVEPEEEEKDVNAKASKI